MNDITKALLNDLNPIIVNLIRVLIIYLASMIAVWIKRFLDTKLKRTIVESAVKFAEQVGISLDGPAKFGLAKAEAIKLLANLGIKITDDELKVLIEQMVQAFYAHYKVVE